MGRRHELLYALNAGGVDPEAISRVDLEKLRLAAEHPMANLLPRVLGPATLRPGTESLGRVTADVETVMLPFLRGLGTSYMLMLSPSQMRIMLDGAIQTVPAVSTVINSGSWSNVSTSPATATGGATLLLTASVSHAAKLRQSVSVSNGDKNTTHILRVAVGRGPVFVRVGTTAGAIDIMDDVELEAGTHKISFIPGVNTIYIDVRADDPVDRQVTQIQFESNLLGGTGELVIPTPWDTIDKIKALRTWQSIDTMFCGDGSSQQRRIEHRGPLSWGISIYKTDDGPFTAGSNKLTMTPSAQIGNVSITASDPYFQTSHVGALIELTHSGKVVTNTFDALDQTSDYITVVGVTAGRNFFVTGTSAAFVGTIVLEQSLDAGGSPVTWTIYASWTDGAVAFARTTENDGLANLTAYYRFRVYAYTSGTATMTIDYSGTVDTGVARITGYASSTSVAAEVVSSFANTTATRTWRVGDWSDVRGWPRTPIIHDDRLHWFRDDTDYASKVSDYYNYDDSLEGDSAPFTRSVGIGNQSGVLWAIGLEKLIVGTQMHESVIAASELDEPLTPSKYTVRQPSRQGCLDLEAIAHDIGAFFVQRSGRRLYQITKSDGTKYRSVEVSRLNPAAYRSGIDRHDVQQQPDTRHWSVVDGNLVCLTYDKDDKVTAITTATITNGTVEDVACLPEADQDDVYLIVNRSGARYYERFGKEADQRSVSTCTLLDGHTVLTGSVSSITDAKYAGQTVSIWADGAYRAPVTLSGGGTATLGATYSRVVYGLPYTASFKSVKLAYAAGLGSALGQTKTLHGASIILSTSCLDGVTISGDGTNYDPMPAIVNGAQRTTSQFFSHYDADIFPLQAEWNSDARFWVSVDSSYGPCTIQAIVLDVETRDGANAQAGNS